MLGPHYISQKPDNARACSAPEPAGFVESLIGSITINNAFLGITSRNPTGLETNLGNLSPTRYLISEPEPENSELVPTKTFKLELERA